MTGVSEDLNELDELADSIFEGERGVSPVGEANLHDVITDKLHYPTHPDANILDGVPRYAHKSTTAFHEADETPNQKLVLCQNHELATEHVRDKLTDGEYSVNSHSVVHLKGRGRSCPGCSHELNGKNYYKHQRVAEKELRERGFVTPEVFEGYDDICPYLATRIAAGMARWVVTVPDMIGPLKNDLEDKIDIIMDEEDAMDHFFPAIASVAKYKMSEASERNFDVAEYGFSEKGIEYVQKRLDNKVDDLDRVNSRWKNIQSAIDAFTELTELVKKHENLIENAEDHDEAKKVLDQIEVPQAEFAGNSTEQTATFKELRRHFAHSEVAKRLEAMFHSPKLQVMNSGSEIHVRIVPDPAAGFLIHQDLFREAENVWLVGDKIAKTFAAHFHPNPDECYRFLDNDIDDLTIIKVNAEDDHENDRRRTITEVSKQLTEAHHHNMLIAGSATRAAQAKETIGPSSYFFRGDATLDHYQTIADADWNVTSYMGSRATRGVDLDTQITCVRSSQFATPRWSYHLDSDDSELKQAAVTMADYEQNIELINAMLRGAGQGRPHVAVIPSVKLKMIGLNDYAEVIEFTDLEQIMSRILESIEVKPDNDDDNMFGYYCEACENYYMSRRSLKRHTCIVSEDETLE